MARHRESTNTIKVTRGPAPERPGERRPVLVVLHGSEIGRVYALGRERVVLGRALDCDLVLRDDATSRRHAAIFPLPGAAGPEAALGEYAIEDLGSTNGTLLNGALVKETCALRDGDKIRVGGQLLKLAWLDAWEVEFQQRLHHMTQRDELTGLRSRRSLFAEIERELARAPRPLAVLMLDLDHFRRVNDAYGHLVGSQTVRAVGRLIHDCLGEQADRAARYGGEEYLVWTEGGRSAGTALAERVRAAVEAAHLDSRPGGSDGALRVTTSVGVAAHPDDAEDALELIQKADLALFRAKRTGRNRVCVYDPELDQPDATRREVDLRRIVDGPAEAQ